MPTLNIGKVRYTWKGTYSATTAYNILDRVKDADGYVYEAIKAAPAGTELTNENYWIKLSVQGPRGSKGDTGNDGPKGDPGEAPTAILYTEQNNLTDAQRAQARTNIGAAKDAEVVKLVAQTGLTDTQKAQARTNIGALGSDSLLSYIPKTGDQGAIGGYTSTANTTSISANSLDTSTCNANLTVQNGTNGTSWTKIVHVDSAIAVTLGSGWSWVRGEVPTITPSGILVLCWCGSSGIAVFVSPTA